VLIYLVSLANCLEVDLLKAAEDKLAINAAKYPVEKARGSCAKSSEL
jgi:NTP pyrophosphatase (non-canonical NTP hydrolase)